MITDRDFKEWKQESDNFYLIGDSKDGCGVYREGDWWTGNIVTELGLASVEGIGNYARLEDAMKSARHRWHEKRAALGYEPIEGQVADESPTLF